MSTWIPRWIVAPLAVVLVAGLGAACDGGTEVLPRQTPIASDGGSVLAPAPSGSEAAAVRWFDEVPAMHPSIDGWPAVDVEVSAPDGRRWFLPVRLADDATRRAHGFMEVTDLPVGTGMLFVFDSEGSGGFWMRNTLVPLDIAFIDAGGKVVTTHSMVPCPGDPCPTYPPSSPYLTALEVPAGFWDSIGLEVGWTIRRR